MKNTQKIYKTIMLIFITVIVTLLVSTVCFYNHVRSIDYNGLTQLDVTFNDSDLEDSIKSVREIIDELYLNEVNEEDVIEGAVKGYVEGLGDEYTAYMTKAEWAEYKENNLGTYTGLGVYLLGLEEGIEVIQVIKGSPAEEKGMKEGDIILKVDDLACNEETITDVTNYIKQGEIGTKFTVEYKRGEEVITETFIRENVRIYQIESEVLENNIGYIEIITFDENSAEDFRNNYNELVKQNIKGLIIDLRNNTGGVLTETIEIAQTMLPKNANILVTYSKSDDYIEYKSKTDMEIEIPIVVLVNEYTASASEILAAALQDNNRATILGTKTYGKGVLQEVILLNNGLSALKITTHEFFTPNRDKIHGVGITPDIVLDIPSEYENILQVPEDEDNQLEKAIEILQTENE